MPDVTAPYLRAVPLHEEQASPYMWIAGCLDALEDKLRAMGAAAHDSMVRLGITKDAFANQRVEVYDDV